jgi:hypothetical protein
MPLEIDALNELAAWPGAGRRTPVVLTSQLMAAGLHQEGGPSAPPEMAVGEGVGSTVAVGVAASLTGWLAGS